LDQAAQIKLAVAEAMAAHMGPLGIGWETWAIVLATFAGPVAAIIVSMWLTARAQRRDQLNGRRFWVFRTLLATRGQAITPEHVAALNLIEIDYHGVEPVMREWRTYMAHLHSGPTDRPMTAAENTAFNDRRTDLLAKLLHQVSRFMKLEMGEIDLKRGGYAPSGWAYRDEQDTRMKQAATRLFEGEAPLRVLPWAEPTTLPGEPK